MTWKATACIIWLAAMIPMCCGMIYVEGQRSVRHAAYVKFYPIEGGRTHGPYMGRCLYRPEGIYCAQTEE